MKHIIFDNYDVLSDENKAQAKETLLLNELEEITEDEIENECYCMIDTWFKEEKEMLQSLSESEEVIAIYDANLWNGRRQGYKELSGLDETINFDKDCDYQSLFVDSYGNLRKDESHHDGNNYILYRFWKENITDRQKNNFLDKLYYGKATQKDITRYTRKCGLGIAKLYGWEVQGL